MFPVGRIVCNRLIHATCLHMNRTTSSISVNQKCENHRSQNLSNKYDFKRAFHCAMKNSRQISLIQMFHTTVTSADKKVDMSRVPTLDENDLEESFVRGSGPGGQSVNKTSSACHLKHIPTGFVVKCHEARSLDRNRAKARLLMIEKLDKHYNGDMSITSQKKRLLDTKSRKADQKWKKKQMLKQQWKEREGLD